LTPNELVLTFGGLHLCVKFGENRQRNATVRVTHTDRQTDTHTHRQTDANRFYYLSHAICYSYGADKYLKNWFLKFGISQNGETPYYLEKLTLPLDSQTQCFLFDVQLLWSCDYSKRVIFTKNCILQWKILNFWGCKVGVKNFCTKLPKGTPVRQIWSNKSFGVRGSDLVLTL